MLFTSLIITSAASSQTITATTFYVIPPTAGCNGIWAIDASAWPCGTLGCAYSAGYPMGCLTTIFPACDSIVADTLYLKLCSLPCNIVASCSSGLAVICGTPLPITTSITNQQSQPEIKTAFSDEKILFIENLNSDEVIELYDMTGRKIVSKRSSGTSENIDLNILSKQIYIILVKDKTSRVIYRKKIAW